MRWQNCHLHEFIIQGKAYGVSYDGGMCFKDNPYKIILKDLALRIKERFFYKYNFHVPWELEIRLEKVLPMDSKNFYPICIGGNNVAPSENYIKVVDFIEQQPVKFANTVDYLRESLIKKLNRKRISLDAIRNNVTEIIDYINNYQFNKEDLNSKLKQYIKRDIPLEDLIEEYGDYEDEEVIFYAVKNLCPF